MIRVPEVAIAGHTVGPVCFERRHSRNFRRMAQRTGRPVHGALGGSLFRHSRITVDYPEARAHFERASEESGLSAIEGGRLRPVRLTYEGTISATRILWGTTTEGIPTLTLTSAAETPGRPLTDTLVMDRETLLSVSRRCRGPSPRSWRSNPPLFRVRCAPRIFSHRPRRFRATDCLPCTARSRGSSLFLFSSSLCLVGGCTHSESDDAATTNLWTESKERFGRTAARTAAGWRSQRFETSWPHAAVASSPQQ